MNKYASACAALIISVVFFGAYSGQSQAQDSVDASKQQDFKNLDDRYSYAYGVDLAEKYKAEGIELNPAMLAKGIQDAYAGGELKMSAGEVAATIEIFLEIHAKKKEAERAALGEKNKKEGEAFLAANANKEGVVVTESGLQYKIITNGNGGYRPKENDLVTVHYRGTLINGTEFDSSYRRNEAYTSRVNNLLEGWTEALQMMSEGSKWELYVPPEIAYGEKGSQFIEPNAVLVFEVELLDIEKANQR